MIGKGKPYFWHPSDQCWYDVLACGDLSVEGWVVCLKMAGFCICRLKTKDLTRRKISV
jgi:hypothetical protein